MPYEDIMFVKSSGVAKITINRPDTFNSFRTLTLQEMKEAVGDAAGDGEIGVIVITGAGGKAFCAGGDINEMRDLNPDDGRAFLKILLGLFMEIRSAPKPVITSIDGYCLGGGNEINLVCDMTIATERSVFGQVGPTVGSIPVLAGTQMLPRLVGDKKAKEIIFLCERYSARQAMEMGWINKVVNDGELEKETSAWCDRILAMSPQSLRIAKVSLNYESDHLYSSFMHGIEMLSGTYGSDELVEGMSAFLEKRKPDFGKFRKK
ncbi:MAG TPA: enoyl-CoA hydratase-related protein [bacterium]|nr:enoyl-CoA hydratase-related protein [bacterium]